MKILEEIAHGAYGTVYKVEDIYTNEVSAIKIFESISR